MKVRGLVRTLGAAVIVAVLVAACSGDPEPEASSAPGSSAVASTAATTTAAPTTVAPTTTTMPAWLPEPIDDGVGTWIVEVVERREHNPDLFTQGLVLDAGVMFESGGQYGESSLQETDPATGAVLRSMPVDAEFFAEGLELVDDRLLQLTWQEETLIVWDAADFTEIERIPYEGEGWGLCLAGEALVMSNGSSTLTFRDPIDFTVTGEVDVTLDGVPVTQLNELECVDGFVLANVWQTPQIVVIDPASGRVVAVIDATPLANEMATVPGSDVLNGIAHDEATDTFLLTGKWWPTMYEVTFTAG